MSGGYILLSNYCNCLQSWSCHRKTGRRGMFTILIILFLSTAAATSKSGSNLRNLERNHPPKAPSSVSSLAFPAAATSTSDTRGVDRILERNNRLIGHLDNRRYYFFPFSFGSKTNSGHQEGRGVRTPICWIMHSSKCPRNAWFSRSLGESEESFSDIIGRKMIEQGVLQALALD